MLSDILACIILGSALACVYDFVTGKVLFKRIAKRLTSQIIDQTAKVGGDDMLSGLAGVFGQLATNVTTPAGEITITVGESGKYLEIQTPKGLILVPYRTELHPTMVNHEVHIDGNKVEVYPGVPILITANDIGSNIEIHDPDSGSVVIFKDDEEVTF